MWYIIIPQYIVILYAYWIRDVVKVNSYNSRMLYLKNPPRKYRLRFNVPNFQKKKKRIIHTRRENKKNKWILYAL